MSEKYCRLYGHASCQLSRSDFGRQNVHFLGHVVNAQDIMVDPKKVEVISKWPKPSGVHEVRHHFDLANYRKCIQGTATFAVLCIGAVLMQGGRTIAFEGRKMTPAETRYTVGEQELLAFLTSGAS